jgi:hypothetical protein
MDFLRNYQKSYQEFGGSVNLALEAVGYQRIVISNRFLANG